MKKKRKSVNFDYLRVNKNKNFANFSNESSLFLKQKLICFAKQNVDYRKNVNLSNENH